MTVFAATAGTGCSGHDAQINDAPPSATSSGGGSGRGSPDVAALFGAPSGSATPSSIYGVWAGTTQLGGLTFDTRLKLTQDSATIAARCTNRAGTVVGTVGVTAAARISPESMAFLESKTDAVNEGSERCAVTVTPREHKACAADAKGFEHECFTLAGTTLTDYGETAFDGFALTKLSD